MQKGFLCLSLWGPGCGSETGWGLGVVLRQGSGSRALGMCTPWAEPTKSDSSGAHPCSVHGGAPRGAGDQVIATDNSFPKIGPQSHIAVCGGERLHAAGDWCPDKSRELLDPSPSTLYSQDSLFFGEVPCCLFCPWPTWKWKQSISVSAQEQRRP